MNKIITSIILIIALLNLSNGKIYAQDNNINLDLLIKNKQNQDLLKERIGYLEGVLNKYKNSNENNESVENEIVTLSFVDDNESNNKNEDLNIKTMELNKNKLENELESLIIENAQIEKVLEQETKKYLSDNDLEYIKGIWPLESYKDISSGFGQRIHPITKEVKFHKGIDIPAPNSTDILASDSGIVIFSGIKNGYGNVVKIKHFDGKTTIYAHNSYNIVKEGDIIKKGEPIAKVGSTGDSTGNHLHFEVLLNDENINPIYYLNK